MSTFTIYNTKGEKVGSVEQPALFATPVNERLIHRYLTWVRSMLRATLSNTKTRGEVRGGGRKPWKQKGTGRARIGSTRAPHWRHGGVTFGPLKEQNFETRMPRSERRKAFFSALASKASNEQIIVLDEWNMSAPKTKDVVALLAVLPIKDQGKVLHVHDRFDLNLFNSTRNLPQVTSKTVSALSVVDVLNHDTLIMTKAALEGLEKHFTPAV